MGAIVESHQDERFADLLFFLHFFSLIFILDKKMYQRARRALRMIFNSFYLCAWSFLWTNTHLETGFRCGMFSTAKRLELTFSNPSLCL